MGNPCTHVTHSMRCVKKEPMTAWEAPWLVYREKLPPRRQGAESGKILMKQSRPRGKILAVNPLFGVLSQLQIR